jgi:hypothetical protein
MVCRSELEPGDRERKVMRLVAGRRSVPHGLRTSEDGNYGTEFSGGGNGG